MAVARDGTAKREPEPSEVPESTIRVRADRLERLITSVGELVVAQSLIGADRLIADERLTYGEASLRLKNKAFRTSRLVRELHGAAIGLRMVPLASVFQRVAREARNVARGPEATGDADVVFEGADTELDRDTLEALADALVLLVRSILVHCIEPADERRARGKSATARVRVRGARRGQEVEIIVHHDGYVLDPGEIVEKAKRLGILPKTAKPTPEAALGLLFERGINSGGSQKLVGCPPGLDSLRSLAEALHGSVGLESSAARGTQLSIRLPLNAVLTDGLLVRVGPYCYLLPLKNIVSFLKPAASDYFTIGERGEFASIRGELVSVMRLGALVGVPGVDLDEGILVLLTVGPRRFGLLVDQLIAHQEILSKSLHPLRTSPLVAGSAVLSDGRVGLVLDPEGLMIDIVASSPAWLEMIAELTTAASEYLRLGTSSADAAAAPPSSGLGVRITLLSVATQIEVRISVALEELGATALANHLFGEADPELGQELLNELANIFMGTLKRSFSAESFAFTGGLPERISGAAVLAGGAHARFEKTGRILAGDAELFVHAAMRTRAKQVLSAGQLAEGMVLVRDVVDAKGGAVAERGLRLSAKTIEQIGERVLAGQRFEVIAP